MKSSVSLWLLQCVTIILTILLRASEGTSQSLQYVTGVALETSYQPQLPFTVKAVYGDFQNKNSVWVQLWQVTEKTTQYELMWQTKVKPLIGDGKGEWIELPRTNWVSMKPEYRLGVMNDVTPGPLLEIQNLKSNIILTDITTVVKGIKQGAKIEFDDLGFPYHIPLYACNRTDCRDVRLELGRLTHDDLYQETTATSQSTLIPEQGNTPKATLKLTMSTDLTTAEPSPIGVVDDDLFNKTTIVGILLGLGLLALVLLIVIGVLVGICMAIDRRKRREERYSSHIVHSPGLGIQVNESFDSIGTDRSDTSSKRLVTRDLPEQTIMVY